MYKSTLLLLLNLAGVITALPGTPLQYRRWLEKRQLGGTNIITSPTDPWGPLLSANGGQENWMSTLSDSTPLTRINMPGTHDTGTWAIANDTTGNPPAYQGNPFKTQLSPLSSQLRAGIRFIDVRCHHVNNQFQIWHSFFNTGITFTQVLTDLGNFLQSHPSETVIMRVHNENDYTFDSSTNTRSYGATYDWYKNTNTATKDIFTNKQFTGGSGFTAWPTIGQARGKFIVLVDFDASPKAKSAYGYAYPGGPTQVSNAQFDIEDVYAINSDISEKWTAVTNHLNVVAAATDSTRLYLTYCSGSAANFAGLAKFTPYHVAIQNTDPHSASFDGINKKLWQTMSGTGRLGVMIFDYPGQALVSYIISRN